MEKLKLVQKAYEIDFSKIDDGFLASDQVCHADTIGKAKTILMNKIKWEGWKLKYTDTDICFTNIPVKRSHVRDLYEFEGENIPMYKIHDILNERKRLSILNEMLKDESISFCYIRKGNYYKPNSCGYTDFAFWAGVYTKEEAILAARSCADLSIIPINVKEHNEMIQKEISNLTTRLIATV